MDKGKKHYEKPKAEFVDFSISSNIASSCRFEGTAAEVTSCGYIDNGITYFADGVCEWPVDGEFCYHVPTADVSVFTS